MQFKQERDLLKSLCKGHILDLIEEVGWNETQCAMVRKRYLDFKSKARICMDIHISEAQYTREQKNMLVKLRSFVRHNKNTEITKIYEQLELP